MTARRLVLAAVAALLLAPAALAADGIWVEARPGCRVWLSAEKADNYTFEWVGPCRDGYASGTGTLNIKYQGRPAGWYSGPMTAGKFEGHGIRSYPNGGHYEGDWRDGKRTGEGVQKFPNGARYEGGWKDDRASGSGTLIDEKGGSWSGTWLGGCLRRAGGGVRPPIGVGANDCYGYR
jgi:hypothetical protein